MRISSVSLAAALVLVSLSTSLSGQRPDDQIDARSVALLEQGKAARSGGNTSRAVDLIETALVVDPRNREAYVVLGQIAAGQELHGKAIRMYREALRLEPNDLAALTGQGESMVAKGAVARARENLATIRRVCAKECPEATRLSATIAKGPPATATAQRTVVPTPAQTPAPQAK